MLAELLLFESLPLVFDAPPPEDALVDGVGLVRDVRDPVGVGGRAVEHVDEPEEVNLVLTAGETLEIDGACERREKRNG